MMPRLRFAFLFGWCIGWAPTGNTCLDVGVGWWC